MQKTWKSNLYTNFSIEQGRPNCGFRLFELSKNKKLFLFLLQNDKIFRSSTVIASMPCSITFAIHSKKNMMSQKHRLQINSCF